MKISTTRLAKIKGVTSQTVRRWVKEGRYEYELTHGGHIRIEYKAKKKTILYVRVSSKKQETSIKRQRELLEEAHYGEFNQ